MMRHLYRRMPKKPTTMYRWCSVCQAVMVVIVDPSEVAVCENCRKEKK